MTYIDVFNGDADGICALHQLRLAQPVASTLVTGVKREINLLRHVDATAGDQLTVLDISMDKNREDLNRILEQGARIQYFDHHFAGDIPEHKNLQAFINTDSDVCTSLLVNDYLANKYLAWAVTAAFGDNLFTAAENRAQPLGLNTTQLEQLKQLGTCINYNGYGSSLEDLIFTPEQLYKLIQPYADPFDFINSESAYQTLLEGFNTDISKANNINAEYADDSHALYILPDEKWSRRVSGVYANSLAQDHPDRAHAMLTIQSDGGYLVSVRAPINNKTGADELCRQFETGGGRKAAAGINHLPDNQYDKFLQLFQQAF
ncbi:MAG: DHH family phosphoesterase [Gammaproteobacteria bacterium]|nr:DHH family phosphoesterase [Gammaproteobacteria bacterium]